MSGYTLLRKLGGGGDGDVWEAQRGDATFAVKVARSGNEHVWKRFTREREALLAIGAPMVPSCFELSQSDEGFPALVMERIDGPTVAAWLASRERPPLPEILAMAEAILLAIGAAHERGIVHGDVKPANLLLRDVVAPYAVSLIDFGLSASEDEQVRGRGTPLYAAPEQLAGQLPTEQTDIYSFGVILFEMVTGQRPFEGDHEAVSYGHRLLKPPVPSSIKPTPPALEVLILACLAKDPAHRLQHVDAVLEMLGEIGVDATEKFITSTGISQQADVNEPKPQPVLFVCVRASGQVANMVQRARQHGAFLVEQIRDRYVFCIATETARPLDAALELASDFIEDGVRGTVVQAAEAWLHPRPQGPPLIYCEELDPMRWCPDEATGEVWVNRRVARWLDCDRESYEGPKGLYRLPDRSAETQKVPLIGRDDVLAWVAERAADSYRQPQMTTITGAARIGKTRFAEELLSRAALWLPGARVHLACGEGQSALDALREHAASHSSAPIAVIVDDAHRLPAQVLELLEYGATGGDGFPVWICLIGDPSLLRLRKTLAMNRPGYATRTLGPLGADDGCALAAAFLQPAEYPPRTSLLALTNLAQHIPGRLANLCRRLKREGYVRTRLGGSAYLVMPDMAELADESISEGSLGGASVDLNNLAELAAVLGLKFRLSDAVEVQTLAQRDRPERAIDPGVGLPELVLRGLLSRIGDEFAFISQSTQQLLYKRLPEAERERLHRFAADYHGKLWQKTEDTAELEPLARHATAIFDLETAAQSWLALGDLALAAHRPADAEPLYSSCLDCNPDTVIRTKALCGRGESTQLLHRVPEALRDLEEALDLAQQLRNAELEARALLSAATAHDWDGNVDAAENCVARAALPVQNSGSLAMSARLAAGRGRACWRRGDAAQAKEYFIKARDLGSVSGDYPALIVSMLLLPCVLVPLGELDAATKEFDNVLSFCVAHGDLAHQAGALVNRMWAIKKDPEESLRELTEAIALSRAVGNPFCERAAAHNLAEGLLWSGDFENALLHATRSKALQERFSLSLPGIDALLQARIHAASGELGRARESLSPIPTSDEPMHRAVVFAVQQTADSRWEELLRGANSLSENERLEVLYLWSCASVRAGHALDRPISYAENLLAESPAWRRRFDLLLAAATG